MDVEPHTICFFIIKQNTKDKVTKCACGNQAISGNCVEAISSKRYCVKIF